MSLGVHLEGRKNLGFSQYCLEVWISSSSAVVFSCFCIGLYLTDMYLRSVFWLLKSIHFSRSALSHINAEFCCCVQFVCKAG
jgi:hypothetical protein